MVQLFHVFNIALLLLDYPQLDVHIARSNVSHGFTPLAASVYILYDFQPLTNGVKSLNMYIYLSSLQLAMFGQWRSQKLLGKRKDLITSNSFIVYDRSHRRTGKILLEEAEHNFPE